MIANEENKNCQNCAAQSSEDLLQNIHQTARTLGVYADSLALLVLAKDVDPASAEFQARMIDLLTGAESTIAQLRSCQQEATHPAKLDEEKEEEV